MADGYTTTALGATASFLDSYMRGMNMLVNERRFKREMGMQERLLSLRARDAESLREWRRKLSETSEKQLDVRRQQLLLDIETRAGEVLQVPGMEGTYYQRGYTPGMLRLRDSLLGDSVMSPSGTRTPAVGDLRTGGMGLGATLAPGASEGIPMDQTTGSPFGARTFTVPQRYEETITSPEGVKTTTTKYRSPGQEVVTGKAYPPAPAAPEVDFDTAADQLLAKAEMLRDKEFLGRYRKQIPTWTGVGGIRSRNVLRAVRLWQENLKGDPALMNMSDEQKRIVLSRVWDKAKERKDWFVAGEIGVEEMDPDSIPVSSEDVFWSAQRVMDKNPMSYRPTALMNAVLFQMASLPANIRPTDKELAAVNETLQEAAGSQEAATKIFAGWHSALRNAVGAGAYMPGAKVKWGEPSIIRKFISDLVNPPAPVAREEIPWGMAGIGLIDELFGASVDRWTRFLEAEREKANAERKAKGLAPIDYEAKFRRDREAYEEAFKGKWYTPLFETNEMRRKRLELESRRKKAGYGPGHTGRF